ncbi:MAG: A/G-specific adenine glycosylase [Acidobacteria bacterium]|nr:MAG: A/G-specific adenine glycosylase [Acidobacteriota bacterium]
MHPRLPGGEVPARCQDRKDLRRHIQHAACHHRQAAVEVRRISRYAGISVPPACARRRARLPLLAWYDRSRRALPWREDRNWYRVWVSEIMLQQTTVKAVVPYFEAFLRAFPDVQALASSREEDVLGLWAGLGYYSRARNLLKAARIICAEHEGEFPTDFRAALALPGIGRYTAGAILSIAFGTPFPVVDGNVSRVLARYIAFPDHWDTASAKALWDLLSDVANDGAVSGRVGDFNQALMELGATVCTPRAPLCPECPLGALCQARRLSLQDSIPLKRHARPSVSVDYTVALVKNEERFLMTRTQVGPFPRGLWEFPRIAGRPGNDTAHRLEGEAGLLIETGKVLGTVIHGITHHRITIHVVEGRLLNATVPDGYAWIEPRCPGIGPSAYVKKVLKL